MAFWNKKEKPKPPSDSPKKPENADQSEAAVPAEIIYTGKAQITKLFEAIRVEQTSPVGIGLTTASLFINPYAGVDAPIPSKLSFSEAEAKTFAELTIKLFGQSNESFSESKVVEAAGTAFYDKIKRNFGEDSQELKDYLQGLSQKSNFFKTAITPEQLANEFEKMLAKAQGKTFTAKPKKPSIPVDAKTGEATAPEAEEPESKEKLAFGARKDVTIGGIVIGALAGLGLMATSGKKQEATPGEEQGQEQKPRKVLINWKKLLLGAALVGVTAYAGVRHFKHGESFADMVKMGRVDKDNSQGNANTR